MHTTNCGATVFHHNGDFSGDVIVHDKATGVEVKVHFEAIKHLVAQWLRQKAIEKIEASTDMEVLHKGIG